MSGKNYGIDIGTGNVKLYCESNNSILNQKNVIAIKNKNEPFAYGEEAYEIFEKSPSNVRTVFPVKYGVIFDRKNMMLILENFYKKINKLKIVKGACFYMAVPTDITDVEKRAFHGIIEDSSIKNKKIYYVEKSIADAIGAGADIKNSNGNMVVNIGEETTEVSIISQGGIIISKITRIAGTDFDQEIIRRIEKYHNLIIGRKTAEFLKYKLADLKTDKIETIKIFGQNKLTGLPVEQSIDSSLINDSIKELIKDVFNNVKGIFERTPPEISKDIISNGIYLTGGSAAIKNLDILLEEATGLKVNKVLEPSLTTLRGLKVIMSDSKYNKQKYLPKKIKNNI